MSTTYWNISGSRILNGSRADQSGSDNASVTNWPLADFIVAVHVYTSKGPLDRSVKLRWRDVTDSGTFADLGATGELAYTTNTDLTNDASIATGNFKCTDQGAYTAQPGVEVEDGVAPSLNLADEYESEIHFAVDSSAADIHHQYEFELYDVTMGASIGTLGATITMQGDTVEADLTVNVNLSESNDTALPPVKYGEVPAQGIGLSLSTPEAIITQFVPPTFSPTLHGLGSYNTVWIGFTVYPGDTALAWDSSGTRTCLCNNPKSSGKWYVELQQTYNFATTSAQCYVGIALATHSLTMMVGADPAGWALRGAANGNKTIYHDSVSGGVLFGTSSTPAAPTFMIAVDCDAGKVWFGQDGVWSGDPAAGTGAAYTDTDISSNPIYFAVSVYGGNPSYTKLSFIKNSPSLISYTPPSGFTVWEDAEAENDYRADSWNQDDIGNCWIGGDVYQNIAIPNYWQGAYSTIYCVRSKQSHTSGKFYVEFRPWDFTSYTNVETHLGVANASATLTGLWADGNAWGGYLYDTGTTIYLYRKSNGTGVWLKTFTGAGPLSENSIGMLAIDVDNGKIWLGFNGVWSGDPEAGTGAAYTFTGGQELFLYAPTGLYNTTSIVYTTEMIRAGDHIYRPPAGFIAGWGPRSKSIEFDLSITGALEFTEESGPYFKSTMLEGLALKETSEYAVAFNGTPFWNSSDKSTNCTLTGLHTHQAKGSGTSGWAGVRSVASYSTGKYYFECWCPYTGVQSIGVAVGVATADWDVSTYDLLGADAGGDSWSCEVYDGGSYLTMYKRYQDAQSEVVALTGESNWESTDRVMIAVDFDAGKIWFGWNGTWYGGDPTDSGTAGVMTFTPNTTLFAAAGVIQYTGTGYVAGCVICEETLQYIPSGFSRWGGEMTYNLEHHPLIDAGVGIQATLTGGKVYYAEYAQGLRGGHDFYYGDHTEYLCEISGDLGFSAPLNTGGSTYSVEIKGRLGSTFGRGGEFDWEPSLERFLDHRHTKALLGFYLKGNIYNENYFKYIDHAFKSYELTLSGGAGPIVLPIISFQARIHDDFQSTLEVHIVGPYAGEVRSRPGGSMSLDVVWLFDGNELTRETMLNVLITNVVIKETATKTDITLIGSATKQFPGSKVVELKGIQYESQINGLLRYRAQYEYELNPGDTVIANGRSFIASTVDLSVTINENGAMQETVEVGEAI